MKKYLLTITLQNSTRHPEPIVFLFDDGVEQHLRSDKPDEKPDFDAVIKIEER